MATGERIPKPEIWIVEGLTMPAFPYMCTEAEARQQWHDQFGAEEPILSVERYRMEGTRNPTKRMLFATFAAAGRNVQKYERPLRDSNPRPPHS